MERHARSGSLHHIVWILFQSKDLWASLFICTKKITSLVKEYIGCLTPGSLNFEFQTFTIVFWDYQLPDIKDLEQTVSKFWCSCSGCRAPLGEEIFNSGVSWHWALPLCLGKGESPRTQLVCDSGNPEWAPSAVFICSWSKQATWNMGSYKMSSHLQRSDSVTS